MRRMIRVEPSRESNVPSDLRRIDLIEIVLVHPLNEIADALLVHLLAQRTNERQQMFGSYRCHFRLQYNVATWVMGEARDR